MSKIIKLKIMAILLIPISIFTFVFCAYWFSSENDDYQMVLDDEYHKPPVNVGKVINDVDPEKWAREHPDLPLQMSEGMVAGGNFSTDAKQVLDALNKLLGKSYSQEWINSIVKGPSNVKKWAYFAFPGSIVNYISSGLFPSVQIAQTGIETGWGNASQSWKEGWNPSGMETASPANAAKNWDGAVGVCSSKAPDGLYYVKFKDATAGWIAYGKGAIKGRYKNVPKKPTPESQIKEIADQGWCDAIELPGGGMAYGEAAHREYTRVIVNEINTRNFKELDKYAQQVKNALANVGGGVDGNKPTGKAGEWMPAGASSALKQHGVNMSSMTQQASQFVGFASKYIGTQYVFGAAEGQDKNFDCSSFVQWNYNKVFHINITRSTVSQEYAFHNSLKDKFKQIGINEAKPGDLIYFGPYGSSYHVGIFLKNSGNGCALLLHASNRKPYPAGGVKIGNHPLGTYRIYRYTGMY